MAYLRDQNGNLILDQNGNPIWDGNGTLDVTTNPADLRGHLISALVEGTVSSDLKSLIQTLDNEKLTDIKSFLELLDAERLTDLRSYLELTDSTISTDLKSRLSKEFMNYSDLTAWLESPEQILSDLRSYILRVDLERLADLSAYVQIADNEVLTDLYAELYLAITELTDLRSYLSQVDTEKLTDLTAYLVESERFPHACFTASPRETFKATETCPDRRETHGSHSGIT